jgi:hypothetical protein
MNTALLEELVAQWRADATTLRRRGAIPHAEVLEGAASELEGRLDEWATQELSVSEAAAESGYSEAHLRELVRTRRLPDHRPPGSEGRIVVRRCDLPRKLSDQEVAHDVVAEMVELIR